MLNRNTSGLRRDAQTRSFGLAATLFATISMAASSALLAGDPPQAMHVDAVYVGMHVDAVYVGLKYGNPDGSCVQLSNGMVGCNNNIIQFSTLPFASDYGKPVRGGSGPSRVASYAAARGVPIWNVTGSSSIEWAKWACRTGRFAAIGFFSGHFQTLYGYEPATEKPWIILNNWYNKSTTRYSEAEFKRLHLQSGPWIVVPKRATSPPPEIVRWWE